MVESQIVKKWQEEGYRRGYLMGKVEALLFMLNARYGEVPAELTEAIRQTQQPEVLDRWAVVLVTAETLAQFRHETGL